jgi:hypothetical protein
MTRPDAQDHARSRRLVRSSGTAAPVTPGITREDRRANWHSDVRMPWPDGPGIEPRGDGLGDCVVQLPAAYLVPGSGARRPPDRNVYLQVEGNDLFSQVGQRLSIRRSVACHSEALFRSATSAAQ